MLVGISHRVITNACRFTIRVVVAMKITMTLKMRVLKSVHLLSVRIIDGIISKCLFHSMRPFIVQSKILVSCRLILATVRRMSPIGTTIQRLSDADNSTSEAAVETIIVSRLKVSARAVAVRKTMNRDVNRQQERLNRQGTLSLQHKPDNLLMEDKKTVVSWITQPEIVKNSIDDTTTTVDTESALSSVILDVTAMRTTSRLSRIVRACATVRLQLATWLRSMDDALRISQDGITMRIIASVRSSSSADAKATRTTSKTRDRASELAEKTARKQRLKKLLDQHPLPDP